MPLKQITTGFKSEFLANGGRLLVSEGTQLFEDRHAYNIGPVLWETVDNTNGTVAHLPNESGVSMSIPGASGDKLTRQTFQHFTYTPGQVLKFEFGTTFPTANANLRTRAGAFTTENGIFFERSGTTVNVVRRSKTSGSVVDSAVAQASWNVDKLNGTGPSGKTLDLTKSQMVFIRYAWYGVGTVEIGFTIDGEQIIAHRFPTGNTLTTPWATTGNLPIRYEIENTAATAATSVLKTYGASVVTEGGPTIDRGFLFSAEGTVTAASGTRTHLLSVRPKTTFNSITNRTQWELESIELLVTGNSPVKWEIGFGHTLTTPSWTDANTTYSASEYDTTGTISTQPTIITNAGYSEASARSDGQLRLTTKNILPLTLTAAGANRDLGTIGLFVTGLGASSACQGIFNWREVI